MTLSRLARKNIRGLRHKYVSYLLSSAFSVMVFFMFASFVSHPDVITGRILSAAKVRAGMKACQYIIVVFSFFFIWYSGSAFVSSRKREFGLVTLLGATKRQIDGMLAVETGVIGSAAVALGIGSGTVLFRLMLMAMGRILEVETPIRFAIVPRAVWITLLAYGGLFFVNALMTMRLIRTSEVIHLVRAAAKPKGVPRHSKLMALLSVVCLGGGYALAWVTGGHSMIRAMLPIAGIVSLGTYFLFTQLSVAVFRWFQKRKSVYYRRLNLLTVADMVFKIKENAQVLTSVAILMAVVLTTTATIYTVREVLVKQAEDLRYYALAFAMRNEKGISRLSLLVNKELAADGLKVAGEVAVAGLLAPTTQWGDVVILPESEYNRWAGRAGLGQVDVAQGHAARLSRDGAEKVAETLSVQLEGSSVDVSVDRAAKWEGGFWPVGLGYFFVVDDGQYRKMEAATSSRAHVAVFGYQTDEWLKSRQAVERLKGKLSGSNLVGFSSRVEPYMSSRQSGALTAFIAMFITTLFSIASGSVLYSRLFTELQEDQAKYASLRRLGLSRKEMASVITRQVSILFFAPFLVGCAHCLMAFKTLSNCIPIPIWHFAGLSIGIFFALQVVYFLMTCSAYIREATPAR